MNERNYFAANFLFSILLIALFLFIIQDLVGMWFSIHIFLGLAYLLITFIGVYGMWKKRLWSPAVFIILFGSMAIDGFYLLSAVRSFEVWLFVIISIIALYAAVIRADIYRAIWYRKYKKFMRKESSEGITRKAEQTAPIKRQQNAYHSRKNSARSASSAKELTPKKSKTSKNKKKSRK